MYKANTIALVFAKRKSFIVGQPTRRKGTCSKLPPHRPVGKEFRWPGQGVIKG
jgi:hypothetical protein